jgi:hypothetical protein
MSISAVQRIVGLGLAVFVVVLCVKAQDRSALIGKWNMTSESDDGSVAWTLTIKEDGGKLMALLAADGPETPARNLTFSDGVLKFVAPYQGEDYDIVLKLQADRLVGSWSGGGNDGKTTGTKAKS